MWFVPIYARTFSVFIAGNKCAVHVKSYTLSREWYFSKAEHNCGQLEYNELGCSTQHYLIFIQSRSLGYE